MLQRTPHRASRPLRLVVETDDPALAFSDFTAFVLDGFDVTVCSGPTDDPCPACEGHGCALLDDADVVLNALRDRASQERVVRGVRAAAPDLPVVVMRDSDDEIDLPRGCTQISATTSVNGQAAALRRAAVRR